MKNWIFVAGTVRLGRDFHLGILSFVRAADRLEIGDDVYIGKFCTIQCNGTIGDGVLIANHVGIVGRRDHDFRQIGVTIRRAAWVGTDKRLSQDPANRIDIGPDVWIGYGSTVLSGIRIGRGAVVAAGSVVRDDVEAYAIVAGNPAVAVGRRFDDKEIAEHESRLAARNSRACSDDVMRLKS